MLLELLKPIIQVLLLWLQNASILGILFATGIFILLAFLFTKLLWTHQEDLEQKEIRKLSRQVQKLHCWYKLEFMEKPL